MGGGPTTTQNQSSTTQPWAPAQGQLQGLLGQLGNVNTSVTPGQTSAINNLTGAANGLPNFGGQATGAAGSLFGGGGANNQAGTVQGAYGNLQNSLSPLTNPANLNPFSTPGFSDAYAKMQNDIGNNVNDRFAAAGRDLSPGNTTALATGLAQGGGQLIANQYNQNAQNLMGASNSLYGAGLNTGNALTNYNQQGNQNMLAGAGLAGQIPGLSMQPGQAQLGVANTAQNQPFANLGAYESLLTPLAQLGSQSQGTSTSQTSTPLWQQLAGLGIAGAGMFMGGPAGAGGLSALTSLGGMLGGNPGAQNSSYAPGGAYAGGMPSFQNGQYNPMF